MAGPAPPAVCFRCLAPVFLPLRLSFPRLCRLAQAVPPAPCHRPASTPVRAAHLQRLHLLDHLFPTAMLQVRVLRLWFQYLRRAMVVCQDPLLVQSPASASRQLPRTSQIQSPILLPVACPSRAATATNLACRLQMEVRRYMAAAALHLRSQTTPRHRTDRAQRARRHPTTHHRLMVVSPLHRALLAILHQRTVAVPLFLLRPPPQSPLQPRLSVQPMAAGTSPTPMVPSTPYTVGRTSLVHPSTLRTAAKPPPTRSSRAWLSVINTPLVSVLPQMAQAVIFSALSLALQVAPVLWQRTRCLDLRRLSRLLLCAPTR